MQTENPKHQPLTSFFRKCFQRQRDNHHNAVAHASWWRSRWLGYIISFLLVGTLLLIERIDRQIPEISLFIGTPFALVAILIALLWGTGPALVSLVLGLIVVIQFISPSILTTDVLRDAVILGPFLCLQGVAIFTVLRLERFNRNILASHRDQEATNQKLFESNEQLDRANTLKDYVLTRAAHELRTPLTTILGRTQLLSNHLDKSGATPENWEELQKYVEVIKVRSFYLRALLDDLFELSYASSREIPLHLTQCDLASLCRDVIEAQRVASGRAIMLELPASRIVLQADDRHLSQVLENVVDNAVKYSPEQSPIHVGVHVDNAFVTVSVRNECPTFLQEQLEHLFEPFYRAPDVEYSPIRGWGLGLTISKEIVERHGGQIWAEALPGQGITFFIKLPLSAHMEPE